MSQQTVWKLKTPPQTKVRVDEDVLAMRAPLVRVYREGDGTWCFDGPAAAPRPWQSVVLGAVVDAWPHVAALTEIAPGSMAVWSWRHHGWAGEPYCTCGNCVSPKAMDLDRANWPDDLNPERIVHVEQPALTGEVWLAEIIHNANGIALLGPGTHARTSDKMTPAAMANVIRRWPHTLQVFRALHQGRGMRWSSSHLHWQEYVLG